MKYEHCHNPVHFGPLAADIRDRHDPALKYGMLNKLSWYHTSVYADWPSIEFESEMRARLSTSRVPNFGGFA
jgi:hypothetical protein